MKIKFLKMMMNLKTILIVLLNCKYNCVTYSNYTYYQIDDYLLSDDYLPLQLNFQILKTKKCKVHVILNDEIISLLTLYCL